MAFQQARQCSPQKTQTQQTTSRLAVRALTVQAQQDSDRPPTHMADSQAQSLERAARFGHHFANISIHPPDTQASAPVQPKQMTGAHPLSSVEQRPNPTGLPDRLKAGIENLSGLAMDHVRVHYHSDKPAQLNALAYTQGTDIHVGPGQERHLPHEAWHVVQQAQGRVEPTMQMKDGVPVNDDKGLEHEADAMGAKALVSAATANVSYRPRARAGATSRHTASPEGKQVTVQRTVLVASSSQGMAQDIRPLVSPGPFFDAKAAYTLLQHLDWALGFAGPAMVDFDGADLSGATSPLLIIAHGEKGFVNIHDGNDIANKLLDPKQGLPAGWTGKIFITSCFSGLATGTGAADAVVDVVTQKLKPTHPGVTVTGYAGETITHRTFGNALFVVLDDARWQAIASRYEALPQNQRILSAWVTAVAANLPKNLADLEKLARDTAVITEPIYQAMIKEASVAPGVIDKQTIA
jgi:hypothetical protein